MSIVYYRLLCVLVIMFTGIVQARAISIAVIVHPSNTTEVSRKDIKNIYLANLTSFKNGVKIIPLSRSSQTSQYKYFIKYVLKKRRHQMKAFWGQQLYTGRGVPPKKLKSNQSVINIVSKNPSAIGYIDIDSINDSVKVLYVY